jgi:hypothetical protein
MTDHEDMDENLDDLVARYSTSLDQLDSETRQKIEEADAWEARQAAAGLIAAPNPRLDDDMPIGLDETNNYEPFPVDQPRRPSAT